MALNVYTLDEVRDRLCALSAASQATTSQLIEMLQALESPHPFPDSRRLGTERTSAAGDRRQLFTAIAHAMALALRQEGYRAALGDAARSFGIDPRALCRTGKSVGTSGRFVEILGGE